VMSVSFHPFFDKLSRVYHQRKRDLFFERHPEIWAFPSSSFGRSTHRSFVPRARCFHTPLFITIPPFSFFSVVVAFYGIFPLSRALSPVCEPSSFLRANPLSPPCPWSSFPRIFVWSSCFFPKSSHFDHPVSLKPRHPSPRFSSDLMWPAPFQKPCLNQKRL